MQQKGSLDRRYTRNTDMVSSCASDKEAQKWALMVKLNNYLPDHVRDRTE